MESGGWSFSHYYRGRHVECHFGSKRRQNSEAGRPGAVTCGGHHQLLSGSLKECPALMRQMNIAAEIKAHKETDGEKEAKTDACCPCQISVSACHVSIPLLSAPHFIHYSAFYWLKARGGGGELVSEGGRGHNGVWSQTHLCLCVCLQLGARCPNWGLTVCIWWRISTEISDPDTFRFTWLHATVGENAGGVPSYCSQ